MLKHFGLFFLCSVSFFSVAQSPTLTQEEDNADLKYITDDLYTFLHAGPGRNYRILGSVIAGNAVQVINTDEQSGFVEVIDDQDRTGWVDGRFIVSEPSIRVQLPELNTRVTSANEQINQLINENERLNQQLSGISESRTEQDERLLQLEQENSRLTEQLAAKGKAEEQNWMVKGGGLALGSLLIGVVLSFVLKGRKRRDGWM